MLRATSAITLLASLYTTAALRLHHAVTAVFVTPGWDVSAPAVVVNDGTQPLRVIVEMDDSQMPAGSYPYFCWGPSCYAPGVRVSPDTVTIAPGAEEHSFKAYVLVEAGTSSGSAPLLFRFRDALSGAILLEHLVQVQISPPSPDSLALVWAQTGLTTSTEGEISSNAALYNASSVTRQLLTHVEPIGIPTHALRFCLGDSCYDAGTLTAPDTLSLWPRHFYPRFSCWLRTSGNTSGGAIVRFTDATTLQTVAEYRIRLAPLTSVEAPMTAPCTLLPLILHTEAVPIRAEAGSTVEIYTPLGQRLFQYIVPSNSPQWLSIRSLAGGLYLYRLLQSGSVICSGLFFRSN